MLTKYLECDGCHAEYERCCEHYPYPRPESNDEAVVDAVHQTIRCMKCKNGFGAVNTPWPEPFKPEQ